MIASILLPLRPPELPGQSLVRCGELFGITEGTSRVALSRMVRAGELESDQGVYHLTGRLLERQTRQEFSRRPLLRSFAGRWVVAVVVGERRPASERSALRTALRRLRLAELREGVWTRPDNLRGWEDQVSASGEPVRSSCLWLVTEPASGVASGPIGDLSGAAGRLWDLHGWAERATQLLRGLSDTRPRLESGATSALAPGFRVAAASVRHLTADPLLPDTLLPPDWPGPALRVEYDAFEHAYRRVLRDWLTGRDNGGSREDDLPSS